LFPGDFAVAYFEWADDMVIDNGPIDQDHQTLVRQVNELHTATSEGRGHEVVGRLLGELIRDTVEHIRREEQEMARVGYPRLVQHKQGHDQFVADLQVLQRKFEGGSSTVASQLSSVLRDWLSLHIRRYDKDMLKFTQQQSRSRAPA
jgi:hemerythrin-like metal-binding protein